MDFNSARIGKECSQREDLTSTLSALHLSNSVWTERRCLRSSVVLPATTSKEDALDAFIFCINNK
jgi:hypothetical protein